MCRGEEMEAEFARVLGVSTRDLGWEKGCTKTTIRLWVPNLTLGRWQ